MKGKVRWKRWGSLLCLFCLLFVCGGCSGFFCSVKNGQSLMTKEAELNTGASNDTMSETASDEKDATEEQGNTTSVDSTKDQESLNTEDKIIYVHVCGCVKSPGLYEFAAGIRAGNAVERAGGFTKKADPSAVNLASVLEDGMQLYVPSKEEKASSGGVPVEGEENVQEEAPVNINTAGAEELMTLSGIGESRAEAILLYREENGAFSSIDDIKNVSGIGEGIFERIKNMITV